jgi:hypothetical protein
MQLEEKNMKYLVLATLCIVIVLGPVTLAQENAAKIAIEPKTGDVEFDATLGDLNIEAEGNLSEFLSRLSISFNISEESLEPLIIEEEMTPADVYMTVAIAEITETPVNEVVEEYKNSQGQGWGVVAKRLGIKPGSKEFHLLKQGTLGELDDIRGRVKSKGKGKAGAPGQQKKEKKSSKK